MQLKIAQLVALVALAGTWGAQANEVAATAAPATNVASQEDFIVDVHVKASLRSRIQQNLDNAGVKNVEVKVTEDDDEEVDDATEAPVDGDAAEGDNKNDDATTDGEEGNDTTEAPVDGDAAVDNKGDDATADATEAPAVGGAEDTTEQPGEGDESVTEQPTDGGEAATEQPTEGGEAATEQPTEGGEAATEQPTDGGGEVATEQPTEGGEAATEQPADGGEVVTEQPTEGGEAATEQPTDGGEVSTEQQPTEEPAPEQLTKGEEVAKLSQQNNKASNNNKVKNPNKKGGKKASFIQISAESTEDATVESSLKDKILKALEDGEEDQ